MAWLETVRSNLSPLTFNLMLALVIVAFIIGVAWTARGLAQRARDHLASYWNSRQAENAQLQTSGASAEADPMPLAQPDGPSPEEDADAADSVVQGAQDDIEPAPSVDAQLAPAKMQTDAPTAQLSTWSDGLFICNIPRLSARPVMGKRTTQDFR